MGCRGWPSLVGLGRGQWGSVGVGAVGDGTG